MKLRIPYIVLALSLVSCLPRLESKGMLKADLKAEIHYKTKVDLNNYKTIVSSLRFFEEIDVFDKFLNTNRYSMSDWRTGYEEIKLDLERERIEGPVLLVQTSNVMGLIRSENVDLIDLETEEVILSIGVPIPNRGDPYPFRERRATYEALRNTLIQYIAENSEWELSQNPDIIR